MLVLLLLFFRFFAHLVFHFDQWLKFDFVWNAVRQLWFCINADDEHLFRWELSVFCVYDMQKMAVFWTLRFIDNDIVESVALKWHNNK